MGHHSLLTSESESTQSYRGASALAAYSLLTSESESTQSDDVGLNYVITSLLTSESESTQSIHLLMLEAEIQSADF